MEELKLLTKFDLKLSSDIVASKREPWKKETSKTCFFALGTRNLKPCRHRRFNFITWFQVGHYWKIYQIIGDL